MIWFENVPRYIEAFDLKQFNYSMLTRSQRVSHENLRLRDKTWLDSMETHLAQRHLGPAANDPLPPMFLPFSLREMTLQNRVCVSPMCMYSATDGLPDDWHLVHYGSLAKGGAALVYTEMTNVSADGRITPGCTGIWSDAHRGLAAHHRFRSSTYQSQNGDSDRSCGPQGSHSGTVEMGPENPRRAPTRKPTVATAVCQRRCPSTPTAPFPGQ